MRKKRRGKTAYVRKKPGKLAGRKAKSLTVIHGMKRRGKIARRKAKVLAVIRSGITLTAELGGIATFLIAVYNFLKEFL